MKSFKQFILEESDLTAEQIAQKILKDCQFFLKEINFHPENVFYHGLFRGIGIKTNDEKNILRKWRVNDSREPKDMPRELHDTLDDFFEEEFGTRFRSESLFATGSKSMAREYGIVFLVFPIGRFEYIWSPVVRDAWEYFSNEHDYTSNQLKKVLHTTDNLYVNKNLDEGIESGNEIMIACESYYTIPLVDWTYNRFGADNGKFIEEIFKHM